MNRKEIIEEITEEQVRKGIVSVYRGLGKAITCSEGPEFHTVIEGTHVGVKIFYADSSMVTMLTDKLREKMNIILDPTIEQLLKVFRCGDFIGAIGCELIDPDNLMYTDVIAKI